ncbi:uncharacterized protein LOC120634300 isoform X2 [Pararge aegeria]|uniref:uncharacterized protein LOC120634300 isoform X2 n=1 Tax=Pararge aegeria TaxID=116150 RepID=UPI0019D04EBC|nr:uncharacterized protein LOC120634300 isoform X2 [Pararge aegeria]
MREDNMSISNAEASDESDLETDPEKIKSKLEKCEEELFRLRSPAAPGLGVTEVPVEHYQLEDLLQQIMPALSENYDTTFLEDYLRVLQNEEEAVIKSVTHNVLAAVEDALRQQAGRRDDPLGGQRVVLCAFLCAAALAAGPRARPALRQLLARATEDEVGVCKLQILFGTEDKVKSATKRRRTRREH